MSLPMVAEVAMEASSIPTRRVAVAVQVRFWDLVPTVNWWDAMVGGCLSVFLFVSDNHSDSWKKCQHL